jgi:hypothetical protein
VGTRRLVAILFLVAAIASVVPQVGAYTFSVHSICKGWTQDQTPIAAESYLPGDTVYLYFRIVWTDVSEFKAKWVDLPGLEGTWTAESAMEYFPLKSFRIQLSSPTEEVVNSFGQRKMWKVTYEASTIASAFLEILNVTSTTENGIWHLKWFDEAALVFDEQFTVGQPPAQPAAKTTLMTTETTSGASSVAPPTGGFFEGYLLWIVIAVGAVAVVLLAFWKTRIAKPPAAPVHPAAEAPHPPTPQEITHPDGAKYCIQCGELIPEVAVYCPRCASKQEQ